MAISLRPYQEELIHKIRHSLRSNSSVLTVAPTGTGKTALTTTMIGNAVSKAKKAFFIVHRQELIEQSSIAFSDNDVPHGFVCAGQPINPFVPVHICSIDTLKNRLDRLPHPDLIVFDEAHHCKAATWQRVKEYYSHSKIIGLTATPCRLDGKGLGDIFEDMIQAPPVNWFIEKGYLSKYKIFAPHVPNMAGIHSKMGDYVKSDLDALMDNSAIVGNAIQHYRQHAHGKKAVAFCVSIKHSQHVAAEFNAAGYKAVHIDGSMSKNERKKAIENFRHGDTQILVNVDLIGEGFDLPDIVVAILLRPTQSLALYLQQIGRCLRPVPGKEYAIILDHAGNIFRHGLPCAERFWTLEGEVFKHKKKGEKESAITFRRCAKCYYVPLKTEKCPICGFLNEIVGDVPKELLGQLVEIDVKTFAQQLKLPLEENKPPQTFDSLIQLAIKRGIKEPVKWAAKVYTMKKAKKKG